ncbi:MAG: hypothetical protein HC904_08205, partial [Blastochloris sp.]|nr:hypothetical protein [Blastochloris sp.]
IAIIVEGGTSGGGTCGPWSVKFHQHPRHGKGSTVDMVYLNPALGHYAGVRDIASTTSAPIEDGIPTALPVSEVIDGAAPLEPVDETAEDPSSSSSPRWSFPHHPGIHEPEKPLTPGS